MSSSSLVWIGLGNVGLNLLLIWLLCRWQIRRRRAAYQALCRQARELCQQAERIGAYAVGTGKRASPS